MISIQSRGSFSSTDAFLKKATKSDILAILNRFGQAGVSALIANTPFDTGRTAVAWKYRIKKTGRGYRIEWYNTNVQNGAQVAVLIQYGHGTGTGGYVQGIDYINPAMAPIFDASIADVWKEVSRP